MAAKNDIQLSGIHDSDCGLIQAVADNFDADISSQKGKLTTHSLAMLIAQPQSTALENQDTGETIRRVSKADMSQSTDFDISIKL